jgi:U3 small nucleolar ribonucleoprotein protein IMP4
MLSEITSIGEGDPDRNRNEMIYYHSVRTRQYTIRGMMVFALKQRRLGSPTSGSGPTAITRPIRLASFQKFHASASISYAPILNPIPHTSTQPTAAMIRKQARERRDYLYRRALTLRDAELADKRASLKASLASGKPLQRDVADDETLRADYKYDESRADRTVEEELGLDDEYAQLSGVVDPRILVTTSRDPSSRLGTFAKEIRLLLPTAIRLNRGNLILPNLVDSAKSSGLSDIVLLHEHRGTPTALTVSHFPHGPTASFSLHNVVLRADIPNSARGTVSESYPHLIFEGFSTKLGQRVVQVLKHLFPPREGTAKIGNRVVT